jgi:hypothetical protein
MRYTNRTGTCIILATEIAPRPDSALHLQGEDRRADLYAYQYPAAGGLPTWQVHEFVAECPLDLEARFLPGGFTVTNLDQDGIANVWLVYRTTCQGDVSPSTQKIIMNEGPRKYAVRGTSRIALGNGTYAGGTYTLDAT